MKKRAQFIAMLTTLFFYERYVPLHRGAPGCMNDAFESQWVILPLNMSQKIATTIPEKTANFFLNDTTLTQLSIRIWTHPLDLFTYTTQWMANQIPTMTEPREMLTALKPMGNNLAYLQRRYKWVQCLHEWAPSLDFNQMKMKD